MFRGVHKFCKFTVFQTGTVNLSSIELNWALYATTDKNLQFHLRLLISLSRHSPPIEADSRHFYDFCANFFAYNLPIERTNAIDLREISYNKGKLVLQIRSGDFLRWKVFRILFYLFAPFDDLKQILTGNVLISNRRFARDLCLNPSFRDYRASNRFKKIPKG